ncbi:MAG: nitronate monooxygenase [Deltaproteobacteria bacterium]|nr:nitronate monooxygenase [Deltaproteobacteria bacterium]
METPFTRAVGCRYPLIAGPMFLVSNEDLVVAVSEAGGVGGMPSLNWRTTGAFREAVRAVKSRTKNPFAVNIIVNKAVPRQYDDLDVCVEERVPLVITSLGNPKDAILRMHEIGCKVFCDVTTLEYAKKVAGLGADGVIAVSAGAGGHAGTISPLVFIPYLQKHLSIPVVAAGGIATGRQFAAALMLGASAVQIGTRFIASAEANVDIRYKQAIVDAEPEDIVLTKKMSGTPASVIKTPFVEKMGLDLNFVEEFLHHHPRTKKYVKMARSYLGAKLLERAAKLPTWKELWSAGQGVAFIEDIVPAGDIVARLVREYHEARVP